MKMDTIASPWHYDQTGGRVFLFLETDNFEREHARMTAAGVRFVMAPRREAYGVVSVFEDLYGSRWDLMQPKSTHDYEMRP